MMIRPAGQMAVRWLFRRDEPGEDGGGFADEGPSLSDIADGLDEGADELEPEPLADDEPADDTPEDSEPAADAPAEPTDDPELDLGEGVKAKRSELRAAMSKASDYTAKTTEVAQRERQAREFAQQVNGRFTQAQQQVQQVMQFLQQDMMSTAPDAGLINTNPQEYLRQRAHHEERVSRYQQAMQVSQALQGQQQQTTQAQQAHIEQVENARLLDAIPEWKDAKVRSSESGKITAYLSQIGLTPQEISAMSDHRGLLIARDAAKWREYQGLKDKRVPQAKPVPARTVRPGAVQAPQANGQAKALERARRNPNDERSLIGALPDNF